MASDLDTDAAQAHAMFRSFDGMEGVPELAPAPPRKRTLQDTVSAVYPGVVVALTIGTAATWLSQHYGARRLLDIGRDTRQAVWLALVISVAVMVVLNHLSPLLLWLGIERDVVELAAGYLHRHVVQELMHPIRQPCPNDKLRGHQ